MRGITRPVARWIWIVLLIAFTTFTAAADTRPTTGPGSPTAYDPTTLAGIVADLSAERYVVRSRASRALEALPAEAVPALEQMVANGQLPNEARIRIENLLPRLRTRASASMYERTLSEETPWTRQQALAAYETGGHGNAKWDAAARRAIGLAVVPRMDRSRTSLDEDRAFAAIDEAINEGCDDPLVQFLRIRRLRQSNRISKNEAGERVDEAVAGIVTGHYPPFWQLEASLFRAEQLLGLANSEVPYRNKRIASEDLARSRELIPTVLAMRDLPSTYVSEIGDQFLDLRIRLTQDPRASVTEVTSALEAAHVSQAAVLCFQGRAHLTALRGMWDWCVDPLTRHRFNSTMKSKEEAEIAAECLSKAWALDKDDPAAPSGMVVLAQHHGMPPDEMEKWFKRAMDAYCNNFEACSAKMRYLYSFEGPEAAIEFGRWCLAGGNWQGRLPLVLVDAHLYVASHGPGDEYLGRPEVWKDLETVYEGCLSRYPGSARDRSFYTWLACRAGRWDVANKQFQLLGEDAVFERFGGRADYAYWKRKATAATQPAHP